MKCPICKTSGEVILSIKFKEIVGLTNEFKQIINYCDNCQFVFANSIGEKTMEKYYKELESSHYSGIIGEQLLHDTGRIKLANRQYSFIMDKISKIESVFDIGAFFGTNLSVFKNKGFEVSGLDPSKNNVNFAKQYYDINLFCGTLNDYISDSTELTKFDLIVLSHVLEHVPDIMTFLKQISLINKKYLYLEVPAALDVQYSTEPFGIFFYEHVNYFSLECLGIVMNGIGYNCLRASIEMNVDGTEPGNPSLCTLWELSSKTDQPKFDFVLKTKDLLKSYFLSSTEKFQEIKNKISNIPQTAKLAIWGAGSHTSRLLGMTDLSKKNICKIYDSDPQKHNFTMLNIHITPFNVTDIINGDVDHIIISTFGGEEHILKILNPLNLNVNIISLYHNL